MKKTKTNQDCVVFMSAYKVNDYKRNVINIGKKELNKDILKQFHIESISTSDNILTQKGVLKYIRKFDSYKQLTSFEFEVTQKGETLDDYKNEIENAAWIFGLSHSMELVLDRYFFNLPFYITMKSFFLVTINNTVLQVDPLAFFMNDVLFINYELIDYNTAVPLNKDDVLGRNKNYNILLTEKVRYFNEQDFKEKNDRISHIIFDNIMRCFECILKNKFTVDTFSFVHNIFVMTEKIKDMEKYFLDVLGVNKLEIDLKNINNNNAYNYYSQEYLGVVTDIAEECKQQALFDCQLLEALKMYFMLNQIINFDITNNLEALIEKQLEVERLLYLTNVPIITLNAIENIKKTNSFRLFDKAIHFKVSYLKLYQEKRKNKNAVLLNVLLYILAFMSGIGAIPVIQNAFGIPIKSCFIILSTIFIILGVVWFKSEIKK